MRWTYGRLFCDVGCAAGDLAGAVVSRVLWGVIVALVAVFAPRAVLADANGCAQLAALLAGRECHTETQYAVITCRTEPGSGNYTRVYTVTTYKNGNTPSESYVGQFLCSAGEQCRSKSPVMASLVKSTGTRMMGCQAGCEFYLGDGDETSNGHGQSLMVGEWFPTGSVCGGPDTIGSGVPGNDTPPKLCGGGSCYDPGTNCFIGVDSTGKEYCVPRPTATGPGGGCASGDTGALCAGNPPPLPPAPPDSPISDPPTEINSTDDYPTTHHPADGSPPINSHITVNNYGAGGSSTTSGQQPGDMGPAPSTSTGLPGPQKGASGGQTCTSPPVCFGDAPTCMVVDQVWLDRCKPKDDKSDLNGNGIPDWIEEQPGGTGDYDVPVTPVNTVVNEETVDVSSINSSGWIGNSCPQLPTVEVFGRSWTMDQNYFCQFLAVMRGIFLLIGGFISARILASGGKQ